MKRFTVHPGQFRDAAVWVLDSYEESQRLKPLETSPVYRAETEPPSFAPIPRPLSKLRMGFRAFDEARASHSHLGIWAVDYCDGIGPRVRIGPLIAELANDLPLWDIEVS